LVVLCGFREYYGEQKWKNLCQICNKNIIEVYQLDFEVYFDSWMNDTNPKISY
jgi:hypothetical protein